MTAPGQIHLGPFELDQPVGKGGMAEVWSGKHHPSRHTVAVKVMAGRAVSDARFLTAFRSEVRAVAGLDHPAIVMVYDYGEISWEAEMQSQGRLRAGCPFLVMELIEGGSLYPWSGKLPWPQLKAVLLSLLDALSHAHARGVIHRDIKPSNVLRDSVRKSVKLTDFGIVYALDTEATGGHERSVLGTPAYMAPEQFNPDPRETGPWTDLYAFGCLAFTLACGDPPFGRQGNLDSFRAAHQKWPAPTLQPRLPVPAAFDTWVRRLLEKSPDRRYRMAADAAWALRTLEDGGAAGDASSGFKTRTEEPEATLVDPPAQPSTGPSQPPVHLDSQKYLDPPTARDRPSLRDAKSLGRDPSSAPIRSPAPPMPDSWRRAERHASATQLLGVGLGLYGLRAIPVIDREPERNALWTALRQVREEGQARLVVLDGYAGCGKSRLAEWLCERAHETGTATTLRAVHSPMEGPADSLGPMVARQLRVQGLAREDTLKRIEAAVRAQGVFDPDEWNALTELVSPATDQDIARGARVIRFMSPIERYALVRRLIDRLTRERPVIVWLDDVQWGFDALGFAAHLLEAQRDEPSPVLVLCTVREEALAEREVEATALAKVVESPSVSRVDVAPLAPEHHAGLVRELLGLEGDVAAQVEERTAGNPLFAVQLVGDWVQRGILEPGETGLRLRAGARVDLPADLGEVWRDRIERVLEGYRFEDSVALELAAVLGQDVDTNEWREVCWRMGLEAPLALVEVLLAQRLARPVEGGPEVGFSFVHGMLRESLEQRARHDGRLERHHAACAEMLSGWSGRAIAERLGRHLLGAGLFESALEPLAEGAEHRFLRGDYAISELLLAERQRAMERVPLAEEDARWGETYVDRSRIARLRGQLEVAEGWARKAWENAERNGWALIEARALEEQGSIARFRGEVGLAVQRMIAAEKMFSDLGDTKRLAWCRMLLGYALVESGDRRRAAARFRSALEDLESSNDLHGESGCLLGLAYVDRLAGRLAQAVLHAERAKQVSDMGGHRTSVAHALNFLGDLARLRGAFDAAEQYYAQADAMNRASGLRDAMFASLNRGLTLVMKRDFDNARRELETAVTVLADVGPGYVGLAHAALLPAAAAAKDWKAWEHHLERATALVHQTGYKDVDIATLARLAGDVASEAGQPERAYEAYAFSLAQWEALDRPEEAQAVQHAIHSVAGAAFGS